MYRYSTAQKRFLPSITVDTLPSLSSLQTEIIIGLILFHILLGPLLSFNNRIGFLQTVGLIAAGLLWLIDNKTDRVLYIMGYIAGAEIIWRVTESAYFYEFGKYSIGVFALLLMAKNRNFGRGWSALPLYYFLLQLPSILLGTTSSNRVVEERIPFIDEIFALLGLDRELIAYSIAGSFALATATTYFSTIKLSKDQITKLLLAMMLPIVSMLALAVFVTLTTRDIQFGASNRVTSGGAGPNQVSSMLGVGALTCFWLVILIEERRFLRSTFIALGILFLSQSALTFSRGGFWTGAIAIAIAAIFLLNNPRYSLTIIIIALIGFMIATYLLFPVLEDFTSGSLGFRFSDFDSTGRDQLAIGELRAFISNPIFGAGPVDVRNYRIINNRAVQHGSHTEYTRLLGEHGMLGLFALFILIGLSIRRFAARSSPSGKAISLSYTVWALLFMAHAAMRLAAPAFLFGFGAVTTDLDSRTEPIQETAAGTGR